MSSVLKKTNVLEGKEKAAIYRRYSIFKDGCDLMIDTVQLRHRIPLPSANELRAQGWLPISKHGDNSWKRNQPMNTETLPRLTWRQTLSGAWLTAEVSLPKMLYPNSVELLDDDDVGQGLMLVTQYVSDVINRRFDAATALVGRIDYYYDFEMVDSNIIRYLSLAATKSISRMTRFVVGQTTVSWRNNPKKKKSKEIKLYDKRAEVWQRLLEGKAAEAELKSASGLLRFEMSYRISDSVRYLAKKLGLPNRKAHYLLSCSIALDELGRALKLLGLDRVSPMGDERPAALRQIFGDTRQVRNLAGFLFFRDHYGEDFWKHGIGGYSRSSVYRYSTALRQAGIGLKSARKLPPLSLPNS
jgi:hypothetical protein